MNDRVPLSAIVTGVVVLILAAIAVFRGTDTGARLLLLVTLGVLGTSVLSILYRHDTQRAFWRGFALFGWGYLVLAFGPWIVGRTEPELPTSQMLTSLHASVATSAHTAPAAATSSAAGTSATASAPGMFAVWANLTQFRMVGNCVFTLLAGLVGSGIAVWFHRSNAVLA